MHHYLTNDIYLLDEVGRTFLPTLNRKHKIPISRKANLERQKTQYDSLNHARVFDIIK